MNNRLLEMFFSTTTGSLPAGIVSAILLVPFLTTLRKLWFNQHQQNKTHGSTIDRGRMHERKLSRVET